MVRVSSVAIVLFAGLCLAQPAQDFSKVTVKSSLVAGSVHVLEGAGGNIGVSSGNDGVFVIDDQFAPLAPKILKAIKAISPKPVKLVFNTHWHGDHTGGNESMGRSGAVIVAQENVRKRMSVEQILPFKGGIKIPPAPSSALPVVTFTEDLTFWLNGDELKVLHLAAAHTDGDSVVFFTKANVLHTGDLFVNATYPIIDVGSGGSVAGMIAAQEKLLTLVNDQTKIIPGHGAVGGKAELKAALTLTTQLRDRIAPLVRAGKSLEEIKGAKPTADLDAKYSNSFVTGDLVTEMFARGLGARSGTGAPSEEGKDAPRKPL
jgi:cyclase